MVFMETHKAKAEMLINAGRQRVFESFIDKNEICQFWLDESSGDLAPNTKVEWTFMVPGAKDTVEVLEFEANAFLKFKWSDNSIVDMSFFDRFGKSTHITVNVTGLKSAQHALDATEGFAILLCDLKAYLENGISGRMVSDKAALIAEHNADN